MGAKIGLYKYNVQQTLCCCASLWTKERDGRGPRAPRAATPTGGGEKGGEERARAQDFIFNITIRFVNIFYGCMQRAISAFLLALSRLARYHPALDVFRFSLVIDTLEESAVSCDGGGVVII